MPSEKEWVAELAPRLEKALQAATIKNATVEVTHGFRLPYTNEVLEYHDKTPKSGGDLRYETDMLILDRLDETRWIPRVIVETKLGRVTTHDALTYSAKAATHKQVHPYLRYGILIGDHGEQAVPVRLFRHGAYFDFMASWKRGEATDREWSNLVDVLIDEIRASRLIQTMLVEHKKKGHKKYSLVHRPLKLT